jgi:flagellum-specific ATP synthase
MTSSVGPFVEILRTQVRHSASMERVGTVTSVAGLIIESEGPNAGLGDLCLVRSSRTNFSVRAEIVGFREHRNLLMPLGDMQGLHVGCEVVASEYPPLPLPGPELMGRVLDPFGRPFDGLGLLPVDRGEGFASTPPHPLRRQRICEPLSTGVRAIDTFIPLGQGQRLGLFSGSGVGKSTLLGMIARGCAADVIVVALVGERGREVREFVEKDLGREGLMRVDHRRGHLRPARSACGCGPRSPRHRWPRRYRDQGRNVLLMMDSVTRFAMAQREIGLAIGEPPGDAGLHALGLLAAAEAARAVAGRASRVPSRRSTRCWSRATTRTSP